MEKKNKRLKLMVEKYRWNITDFSKLDFNQHLSEKFILDDHPWHIAIIPDSYLQIYLETHVEGFEHEFSAHGIFCGYDEFLHLRKSGLHELKNSGNGFIVNDSCIIEVRIFVTKYVDENEDYQPFCNIDDNPVKDNKYPLLREMLRSSFKKIDQNFVPLLEEVCLQHPLLVASQEERSCRFSEWAFTALGGVLHFLKTKKVKDMDDEAYKHLQILWDELQTFGFDLSWLKYNVESALEMKRYMVKAEVRKNVSALKNEIEDLKSEIDEFKARLIERETELEMASKDLRKVEERFGESTLEMAINELRR